MHIENEYVEVIYKNISNKLDLILASQTALLKKVADLKVHRQDAEAHHGVYRVKEDGNCYGK